MHSITKEEAEIKHQEFLANNKKTFEATSYQQEASEDSPKDKVNNVK